MVAVLGLSDVLRAKLPPHIGISILCPGVVKTDFWNASRNRPVALLHGAPEGIVGPKGVIHSEAVRPGEGVRGDELRDRAPARTADHIPDAKHFDFHDSPACLTALPVADVLRIPMDYRAYSMHRTSRRRVTLISPG